MLVSKRVMMLRLVNAISRARRWRTNRSSLPYLSNPRRSQRDPQSPYIDLLSILQRQRILNPCASLRTRLGPDGISHARPIPALPLGAAITTTIINLAYDVIQQTGQLQMRQTIALVGEVRQARLLVLAMRALVRPRLGIILVEGEVQVSLIIREMPVTVSGGEDPIASRLPVV
jgi:hypothetical protein